MQFERALSYNDCVACIHSTLIADDDVGGVTQQIGNLPFTFVTPLRTDDDNVSQEISSSKPLKITANYSSPITGIRQVLSGYA